MRPDQDPRQLEYLGTIIKNNRKFTYYRTEKGEIRFEDEPIEGKPEWMLRAEKERRRRHKLSSAYQLMQKYKNIVLCQECAYRIHEETTNADCCRLGNGSCEGLKAGDGCSFGKRKE